MGSRIPPKGSIPGRKPGGASKVSGDAGLGNLLGIGSLLKGLLKGLGKTLESVQNLNLEDLEKLAETQGNEEAKENVKELKKRLGEKGIGEISDLFKGGLDLSKLVKFATEHGGEFSQEFAGGKGMVKSGIRGHILGRPIGGKDLPLERRETGESQFEVKGKRSQKTPIKKVEVKQEPDIHELEIDPIEEDQNCFKVRGYMAGVDEQDITCQVKENKNTLKILAQGRRKYEKEIDLPSPVTEKVNWSYRNGVLEVTLTKRGSK